MEASKIDTIKFCTSLINKLKRNEPIDTANKLINAGIGTISNAHLKLLIQAESSNNETLNIQSLQELQRKAQILVKEGEQNPTQSQTNWMIQLKLKALILMKQMRSNDINLSVITGHQLISSIQNSQQMKYVLRLLFKVDCLSSLQSLDVTKIKNSNLDSLQNESLFYMLVMVKLAYYPNQAKEILTKQLQGKYKKEQIEREKKAVLAVIKLLLQKQKQLLKSKKPQLIKQQESISTLKQQAKKIIQEKLLHQYKIDVNQPASQTQQKIGALQEKKYLLAAPLFKFYQENNQNVIRSLVSTQIYNKLGKSKKVLSESNRVNTSNSKSKINSQSSSKLKFMSNPQQYSKYLKESARNSQNYSLQCRQGDYFLKHNFNNIYSSLKYVIFTKQMLMWGKNKAQVEQDSTKIKIKNIIGIIYGKTSARLQQYNHQAQCFSILIKNRTLDLSLAKENEAIVLRRFVMGANSIISAYHSAEKLRFTQQKQAKAKEGENEEINNKIQFHGSKIQTITEGKLLWKDLFSCLGKKNQKSGSELFRKAKDIIYFGSQQHRLSLNHSAKKKVVA